VTRASDGRPNGEAAARPRAGLGAAIGAASLVGVAMLLLVVSGLRRSEPPVFAITESADRPADGGLVGPLVLTVDARTPDRWRYFSFDRGTIVERPGPLDWDLAFRRFNVIANGGPGFAGRGGVADLGAVDFDAVDQVPAEGYLGNTVTGDTVNAGIGKWYAYSFFSHLLAPKPRVYAVRTADGRHAKLEFVGYYCEGAVPGCLTFRYVFQGGGGRDLAADAPRP
jgi:hypothetical protein